MNEQPWWYFQIADRIRTQLRPDDEGGLWALLLDDRNLPVVCMAIDDGTTDLDDVLVDRLGDILENVGVAAVLVAVPRRAGAAIPADLTLWRLLSARLAGSSVNLADLIVVGDAATWVASRDGAGAVG